MLNGILRDLKDEDGNILVLTLIVLFAISIIGGTLAMVSSMDLKIAGNQRTTTQALFVAEAGLNEAVHRISLPNPTNVTVGGWTGNAAISDSEPYDPKLGDAHISHGARRCAGGGRFHCHHRNHPEPG